LGYTQTEPSPIYEDNDLVIKIVNHSRPTDCSRHVEIRYFALPHWRLMKDLDSPSWSRESSRYAQQSLGLGRPPSPRALSYGSLWQSLPVICLGSTSSLRLRQGNACDFIEFSLTIHVVFFVFFGAGPFFPTLMRYLLHQGRVSVGQLCNLQLGLMHVSSQTAVYGQSTVADDATALR